ncbi:hypothetical protein OIO90_004644 [Microbotryomycetes sp. JL221]|nr:hypothetical protein OIO90_004644 [Microbotryomycetes sp. JL221]
MHCTKSTTVTAAFLLVLSSLTGSVTASDVSVAKVQRRTGQAIVDGTLRNVTFSELEGIVTWDGPLSEEVPVMMSKRDYEDEEGDDSDQDNNDEDDDSEADAQDTLFDVATNVYMIGDDDVEAGKGSETIITSHETDDATFTNNHGNTLEKRRRRKHKKNKNKGKSKDKGKGGKTAVITWYTGQDLQNPYCGRSSGWTPSDNALVTAPTLDWGSNKPPCGSFIQLRAPKSNRAVIVRGEDECRRSVALDPLLTRCFRSSSLMLHDHPRTFLNPVWDACGGCQPGVPHLDLTLRAFKALYNVDVGKVKGVQWTYVKQPFKKWGSAQVKIYGPQRQ